MISAKQFAFLVFVIRISHAIVALTEPKLVEKGQDAWVAAIIGTIGGTAAVWALLAGAVQRPHLSLIQRCQAAFGPLLGRLVGFLFVLSLLFSTMLTIRMYGGLLVAQPMPETPLEAFLLLITAGASYAAWHGPEVCARMSEIIAPLIVLGTLTVLGLTAKDMTGNSLLPVLGWGWWSPFMAGLVTTSVHLDMLVILMLVPHLREPRRAVAAGVMATLAAGALITLTSAGVVAFYSAPEARRVLYPLYDMARTVSIGDFLERMDPVFITFWTMSNFLKTAVLTWGVATALAQLLGVKGHSYLVFPLAYGFVLFTLRLYNTVAEFMALISPQVYPWFALPFLVGMPGLLSLTERLRSTGRSGS